MNTRFFGIITCQAKLTKNEVLSCGNLYKLKIYDVWWSTNNTFTGSDGGGCYETHSIVNQQGVDLDNIFRFVVDEDFSTNMNQGAPSVSFIKFYAPFYWSAITPEGYSGKCGALTTFKCIFAAGPGMTFTINSSPIHTGWGQLSG